MLLLLLLSPFVATGWQIWLMCALRTEKQPRTALGLAVSPLLHSSSHHPTATAVFCIPTPPAPLLARLGQNVMLGKHVRT
jgi:hypothetical protein